MASERGDLAASGPAWEVGRDFTLGTVSGRRLLAMAAAHPLGSVDPVDLAAEEKLRREFNEVAVPVVRAGDFDPARPDRRYSLTRVRDLEVTEGVRQDTVVMRGELNSVLHATRATREQRFLMERNAQMERMHGGRIIALASAPVAEDGSLGAYTLQGYLTLDARRGTGTTRQGEWIRLNLWSPMLRFQHWLNVLVIFVLSLTGYFIMDPFFGDQYHSGIDTGFLMGWIRLAHFVAGFVWLVIGLTRVILAFTSRDRYMRWPTFWPLRNRGDVANLGKVAQYYLFMRPHAPLYLAHNPLQQLAYTGIYVLGLFQMLTGLALYGLYHPTNPIWAFFSWPAAWFGVPGLRVVHAMVMFLMWAFVIGHIYLAVRADTVERHGGVSSMVNGGVWLASGAKPEDAPEVG